MLTKVLHAEIALGVNNATMKKKTLILMSLSIAISITMFLGFNVFISFLHTSLKTTKPFTPDITLINRQSFDESFLDGVKKLDGLKRIYGRKSDSVEATFDASRITDQYNEMMKGIAVTENGLFTPPEKSWLISYDSQQFDWAKSDLLEGEISPEKMERENGIIAVDKSLRKGVAYRTAHLKAGDKVYINTPNGVREMTVMGVLSMDFLHENSPELTMTTFITTEKLFTELTGKDSYQVLNIQLKNAKNEKLVDSIKSMVKSPVVFQDLRQSNNEINQLYLTMALFVYGFVVVIALISILNIMNTMNTSIASKSSYLGVMRAIGMTGKQLNAMIIAEAGTYTLIGIIAGCILGVMLQKYLILNFLTALSVPWEFPAVQIILICIAAVVVTLISVISPIRRIRSRSVVEVVNAL